MNAPSLQRALLLPIVLIAAAAMFGLGFSEHLTLHERLEEAAAKRAETIANMIALAAVSVGERDGIHKIVRVASAEREVRQIVIAAGRPLTIIASTRQERVGQSVATTPDQKIRDGLISVSGRRATMSLMDRSSDTYLFISPLLVTQPHQISDALTNGVVAIELDQTAGNAQNIRSAWITFFGRCLLLLTTVAVIMLLLRHHVIKPVNLIQDVIKRHTNASDPERMSLPATAELQSLALTLNESFDTVESSRRLLRSAEEFTRSVLNEVPSLISVMDAEQRYVFVNKARADFLGIAADTLIGTYETGLAAGRERNRLVLTATVEVDTVEEFAIDCHGRGRWLLTTRRKLPSVDGATLLLVVSYETTERKRVLRELQEAKDNAEAANRAKSEFLATMSHEIRTPMNGVLGFSEILLQMPLASDQRECVETIYSSGQGLLSVINDILDFSKIEAGKLAPERAPFDILRTIEDVAALVRPQFATKGIRLNIEFPPDCPKLLEGDATRARQVLINLVSNALKFTERGSVSISAMRDADEQVTISIADTGIGIPVPARANLFEKFFQADSTTTRRFGGTGLGLAISKQLIELMGGSIGVDSVCGQGSKFWFRLPLAKTQGPSMTSESPPSAPEPCGNSSIGAALPALLVEDHPVNMMLAKRFIEKLGLTVDCVPNGFVAVERASERRYSMIFMDCHMPELDGFAATDAIRRHDRELGRYTPIIAITASAMQADRDRCFAVGMDEFLSKPVSAARIREVVERVLARSAPSSEFTSPAAPDRVAS